MSRLPFRDWSKTPCRVPGHQHLGPTDHCRRLYAELESLGPDAIICWSCWQPTVKGTVCRYCGHDKTPKPRQSIPASPRRPLRRYEPDGLGCVEHVSDVERTFHETGAY